LGERLLALLDMAVVEFMLKKPFASLIPGA
jgi:hypothetical protein